MAKEYSRTQRVADQIQRELALITQREMKDPRLGMVTISGVEITRDLAYANVHVSFLGLEEREAIDEALGVLQRAAGFLRSQLARTLKLRTTPQLRFFYDDTMRRGQQLSSLIDRALEADAKHDASRSSDAE